MLPGALTIVFWLVLVISLALAINAYAVVFFDPVATSSLGDKMNQLTASVALAITALILVVVWGGWKLFCHLRKTSRVPEEVTVGILETQDFSRPREYIPTPTRMTVEREISEESSVTPSSDVSSERTRVIRLPRRLGLVQS